MARVKGGSWFVGIVCCFFVGVVRAFGSELRLNTTRAVCHDNYTVNINRTIGLCRLHACFKGSVLEPNSCSVCTATYVGSGKFATAAHCIVKPNYSKPKTALLVCPDVNDYQNNDMVYQVNWLSVDKVYWQRRGPDRHSYFCHGYGDRPCNDLASAGDCDCQFAYPNHRNYDVGFVGVGIGRYVGCDNAGNPNWNTYTLRKPAGMKVLRVLSGGTHLYRVIRSAATYSCEAQGSFRFLEGYPVEDGCASWAQPRDLDSDLQRVGRWMPGCIDSDVGSHREEIDLPWCGGDSGGLLQNWSGRAVTTGPTRNSIRRCATSTGRKIFVREAPWLNMAGVGIVNWSRDGVAGLFCKNLGIIFTEHNGKGFSLWIMSQIKKGKTNYAHVIKL